MLMTYKSIKSDHKKMFKCPKKFRKLHKTRKKKMT